MAKQTRTASNQDNSGKPVEQKLLELEIEFKLLKRIAKGLGFLAVVAIGFLLHAEYRISHLHQRITDEGDAQVERIKSTAGIEVGKQLDQRLEGELDPIRKNIRLIYFKAQTTADAGEPYNAAAAGNWHAQIAAEYEMVTKNLPYRTTPAPGY